MTTAACPIPSALKLVVNNHSTVQQRPVRQINANRPNSPGNLKPAEYIAVTAFNMLRVGRGPEDSEARRKFWKRCRQQKLSARLPGIKRFDTVNPSIDKLEHILKHNAEIKAGHTIWNHTAEHPFELLSADKDQVVAVSKIYQTKEFVIVYNTSVNEPTEACVKLNYQNACLKHLQVLYGYESCGNVHVYNTVLKGEKISYIKLYLKPMHLVILKNF